MKIGNVPVFEESALRARIASYPIPELMDIGLVNILPVVECGEMQYGDDQYIGFVAGAVLGTRQKTPYFRMLDSSSALEEGILVGFASLDPSSRGLPDKYFTLDTAPAISEAEAKSRLPIFSFTEEDLRQRSDETFATDIVDRAILQYGGQRFCGYIAGIAQVTRSDGSTYRKFMHAPKMRDSAVSFKLCDLLETDKSTDLKRELVPCTEYIRLIPRV